jgi:acyl dehydratase
MNRSTAKKMRAAAKPVQKPRKKAKPLAKVTRFPAAKVKKPAPAAKKAALPAAHATHPPAAAKKSEPPAPAAKRSEPPPPAPTAKKSEPPARNLPPLTAPKQVTPPKQSLARSFYWSELRVGDDLPPLTKPAIDRVQIVRYSASSGDFNRLHLDEPFAHSVGFPGLFAPGMLPMAFVGQLLTSWLRRGHVRKLSARFVKIVWPGDELTCRGRIAELRKESGACYADVELWAENQKGELVLRGVATCELYESPAVGGGDGGGLLFALQNPPPATPPRKPPSKPPPPKK